MLATTTAALLTISAAGQHKKPAKPAQRTAAHAARAAGAWVSAVGDLGTGPLGWPGPGVTMVVSVPGSPTVLAGLAHAGLWASSNGGRTWTAVGNSAQLNNLPTAILFDPKDPRTYWVSGMYGPGLFKTSDGGATFERLSPIIGLDEVTVDFTDPDRRTLITGAHEVSDSLQVSVSSGRSWHALPSTVPGVAFLSNALIVGDNTFIVSSAGRSSPPGIYRTQDGGKFWVRVASFLPPGNWPQSLPVQTSDGAIYWRKDGPGLMKSVDKGRSWIDVGGPLTTVPVELPGGMLAGAGGGQLYLSRNGGRTWSPIGPVAPYGAAGVAYNAMQRTFYIWHFPNNRDASSIMRWTWK